jgi:hypothetical protein
MKIYSVICTRSKDNITDVFRNLLKFYGSCDITSYVVCGASSIFRSYAKTVKNLDLKDDDVVIFCHDDLEIHEKPEKFVEKITLETKKPGRAFVGLAGTTFLGPEAIWWDQNLWKQGFHRGKVTHLDRFKQPFLTDYGPEGEVVVLDGLFLASTGKFLNQFNLEKPAYFQADWDFYDLHYTSTAYLKGHSNFAMRLDVIHHSRGELAGRASWYMNRDAFIKNTPLPLKANLKELI